MIPYGRHNISEDDIMAVVEVLRSDFLTQGNVLPTFEKKICDYTGARFGVAVNSGTSALHVACIALGLGKGDWLWTSPISFVASANCGIYCGANVDFVDIDPDSWNLSVINLKAKLELAKSEGRLPKIVVAVHFSGHSCEMEDMHHLADEYGFFLIEDGCHAIGGRYRGRPIGCCQYSSITVFSFHPVKNITTGEGGIAMTNSRGLAEKMALARGHGITRDPEQMTKRADGPWYYQQIEIGYNYRMTDFQAALGVSQLNRLDQIIEKRQQIASRYDALLGELPVKLVQRPENQTDRSGMHLYVIRLDFDRASEAHLPLFKFMREQGIGVNLHYIPIHTQPYYRAQGFGDGDFPEAEDYYHSAMSLPLYPELTNEQQDEVVTVLSRGLRRYCKQ